MRAFGRFEWRPSWCTAGTLALLTVIACGEAEPACQFGREHSVFRSETQSFHDLRTVRVAGRVLALFSDSRGVHAQWLDGAGAPSGPARVLFEPCDGGLDVSGSDRALYVACLRRAVSSAVTLYTLDVPQLSVRGQQGFGEAGRLSRGLAVSNSSGDAPPAVLWTDAIWSGARIWYFEPGRMPAPLLLSDVTWDASAPALVRHAGRNYAVWAETRYVGERAVSRILLAVPSATRRAAPRVLLDSHDPAPSPRLVAVDGGLMLSFRDKREAGRKTGLYLARLSTEGRLAGPVVRAGRADGEASLVLEPCLGGVVSATPRTFAGDYFVGVLRADSELRRLSAEQQFYEDTREFDRVAVACGPDSALLVIAERGRLLKGNAALRSTTFRCD